MLALSVLASACSKSAGPVAASTIIETDSGIDETTARWLAPHYMFDAAYAVKTRDAAYTALTFYNARNGAANSLLSTVRPPRTAGSRSSTS